MTSWPLLARWWVFVHDVTSTEFTMPSLGADMDRGTLVQWLVAPGDHVACGDLMAVVDTEKSTIEVEVFTSGVVDELLVEEGTELPVGLPWLSSEPPEPEPAPGPAPATASTPPGPAPAPAPPARSGRQVGHRGRWRRH